MAERRVRGIVRTTRGRLALCRARFTFGRTSRLLNENEPPYDQHRLDFYNAVNARISERRAQVVTVAP
ncbi:MAG: hypothetical protein KBD06_03160 [Candidatus Pacebacteria bacterium]|nr:hypothetical protein [Candidatus Paceibacterota bacterium]